MKTTFLCILAVLAASGPLIAQDDTVTVTPVIEGEAEPGKEWTLKLRFVVPANHHAYHKDNPGGSVPIDVKFTQLSGLVETAQAWPTPKKHKTEFGEEWELEGTFDIAWTFKVPATAGGKLAIGGDYEIQFCNADACFMATGKIDTAVEVEGAAPPPAEKDLAAGAAFEGEVQAGGKAVLAVTFTVRKGWHTYHKDNPGTSIPLKVKLNAGVLKLASEAWPEPKKIDRWNIGSVDWEYEGTFVVKYTFDVPADATGEAKVSGTFTGQVCDEACVDVKGDFSATAAIAAPKPPAPRNDAKDKHGFYLDYDFALSEAKRLGKPLLVDFNGKFCAPCRAMEATVFTLPEVKKLFEDYVVVSLITDVKDATADALWKKHRPSAGAGVPYYAVMDADGEKVVRGIASTLPAEKKSGQFVAFLKGLPIPAPENDTPSKSSGGVPADWPKGLPAPKPAEWDNRFDFEAVFTGPLVKPGGEVTLELRFVLKTGESGKNRLYHPQSPHSVDLGKSLFLLETLSVGGLEPLGEWQYPAPAVLAADDPANSFKQDEWKYYGKFSVVRKFRVPANARDGQTFTVTGSLAGQICDERACVWFTDMDESPFGWRATMAADADGPASAVAEPYHGDKKGKTDLQPPEPRKGGLAGEIEEKGLFIVLLGIFGLGMLTLLTPCVLPVLPLTIAFFVKQSEQGRSSLAAASIYCGCIVATFTVFGLITSLALGEQGAQIISTDPWVNIGIAVLFTVFALSFFGLFELRMPTFVNSWISRKQMNAQRQGRGYATALLSGGSFAIISFSCTGPIAAGILAGIATGIGGEGASGRWIPTLAMLVFAFGLSLPIFVMGQFPGLLKRLPKSGGWMNAVKVVFAFIEIAVAIRYFAWAEIGFTEDPVPHWISRDLVDAFWIACALGTGIYLLGLFRMPHDHEKPEQIGVVRTLLAMVFISFGLYMLPGLVVGKEMGYLDGFLPPRHAHEKWHQDLDAGMAEAKQTGKPVFIDFTGVICANCRWVETNIFPKPEVAPLLKSDFVLVQQWTDKRGDQKAKDYYKKYGEDEKGVPMYVIVDPDGKMLAKYVPPQFINSLTPAEFAEFLRKGKQKLNSGG